MTFAEFNFKIAFTNITIRYSIDTNLSLSDIINTLVNNIFVDFDIRRDYIVEIVEVGQENYDASELAPALERTNISFKNYYINRDYGDLSFYIRVKTDNNTVIQSIRNMRN
jgi:hypothetical protein